MAAIDGDAADPGDVASAPPQPPPCCPVACAPPPSPPCCPGCERAFGAIGAAVAAAAQSAVEAAFAELQPSLVRAVQRVAAETEAPSDSSPQWLRTARRKRRGVDSADDADAGRRAEALLAGQNFNLFSDFEPTEASPREPPAWEPRLTRGASGASGESFRSDTLSRLSGILPDTSSFKVLSRQPSSVGTGAMAPDHAGFPTIESLQVEIASAVLERSGLGAGFSPWMSQTSSARRRVEEEASFDIGAVTDRRVPPLGRAAAYRGVPLPCQVKPLDDDAALSDDNPEVAKSGTWASRGVSRHLTSSQVLQARVDELVLEATSCRDMAAVSESITSLIITAPAPLALRLVGMLGWDARGRPWASAAYQCVVRAIILLALVMFFAPIVPASGAFGTALGGGCGEEWETCWRRVGFLSHVSLPICAVLALLPFGLRRHQLQLMDTFRMVRDVSYERGYTEWEARQHRRDAVVFVIIWLSTVFSAAFVQLPSSAAGASAQVVRHTWAISVLSAVIICLAYCVVRVCRSLVVMIDAFSCDAVSTVHLQHISHIWNITQAVLRKVSADVEGGLLLLCLMLAFLVPLTAIDMAIVGVHIEDLPAIFPGLAAMCGILYALVVAATVSEKCARVPALINAISFGLEREHDRQRVVDYITSSAAGFYVLDTRLTTTTVVKFTYFWCMVVAGVLTKLAVPQF